ncbi:MAG: IucA/IucC family siderophore biosynthesis protein [Steroidobacteraceae bacterium]
MARGGCFDGDVAGADGPLPGSVGALLRFEQRGLWRPERLRDSSAGAGSLGAYFPERGAIFRLPCFRLSGRSVVRYGHSSGLSLAEGSGCAGVGPGEVLLPVHPLEQARYAAALAGAAAREFPGEGPRVWATPTSSTRTVLAWPENRPEQASFVKLSLLSRELGDRALTRTRVARSVGLSGLLERERETLPQALRFFPEGPGLVPRGLPAGGVIFRAIPEEILGGRVVAVPLFALMGGSEGHPPLLRQLMAHLGPGARELIEGVLLARFARLWVDLVFDFGLILEAHAQNLLLALSADAVPLGDFYYRDFEGLTVDWTLRRARGLPAGELPCAGEWFSTYETWGYPLYQLVSIKLMVSLFDYLDLVLGELEAALLAWQAAGGVAGPRVRAGALTGRFCGYLRGAIAEKFGMREGADYDARRHLKRFVKFLMRVRREVLQAGGRQARGARRLQ